MPRRCVVGGCSNKTEDGYRLHTWPKNPQTARIWRNFVANTRARWVPTKWSLVCSAHFTEECYETSALRLSAGYRPTLKEGAYPTLKAKTQPKKRQKRVKLPECPPPSCTEDRGDNISWSALAGDDRASADSREAAPCFLDLLASAAMALPYLDHEHHRDQENWEQSPLPPRSAFKKREHIRILGEIQFNTDIEKDQTIDVECGTDRAVQVKPNVRSTGTQKKYKWKGVDKGIQCDLLQPPPAPVTDEELSDVEMSSDDETESEEDPDYLPEDEDSDSPIDEPMNESSSTDRLFLVHESSLMQLFDFCPGCQAECRAHVKSTFGSAVTIHQVCTGCDIERSWTSQPLVGSTPAGNLLMSAATLFSGCSISKVMLFLRHLGMPSISFATFFKHQRHYLQPAIQSVWVEERQKVDEEIRWRGGDVVAAGDGRADSPGHSAKYGSYTIMDTNLNKVVDLQLVMVTEVPNSNAMEKEGLIRALAAIAERGINLQSLTTDRHTSIRKYLREQKPDINHYLDVWHTVKGLRKKIEQLGTKKGFKKVLPWKRSVTNHMYWTAGTTPEGEPAILKAKWMSVVNHIQNIHQHENPLFPRCAHGDLTGRQRKKKWMVPNEADTEKLVDILTSKPMLKDIEMLSTGSQTSSLESYHAVVNRFAPKMIHFSYQGMKNRLILSALHYNENGGRQQATTKDGTDRYKIVFPKYKKGQHTVQKVLTPCTYGYVEQLKQSVFAAAEKGEKGLPLEQPPTMSSLYPKPNKEDAIRLQRSRFS